MDHIRYLLNNVGRSKTWKTNSVQSIRMFMDFLSANLDQYKSATEAFKGFVDALVFGTVDVNGNDPSGLYWFGLSRTRAKVMVSHLTAYSDYLAVSKNNENLRLNPFREATKYEQLLELASYYHRKSNTFLSHLLDDSASREEQKYSRTVHVHAGTQHRISDVKAFPEDQIGELLTVGFVKRGVSPVAPISRRVDLGNVLITYLLAFGGLRVSEPFHIYLVDITCDNDGCAVVKVYHPEEGLVSNTSGQSETRRKYLLKNFGLLPRTDNLNKKSYYAGWKDPALNSDRFFYVDWFPRSAGIEFYELFKVYVESVRAANTMGFDAKGNAHLKDSARHPFAFVNRDGAPKSYSKFVEQFADAVKRVGLVPRKNNGTTPHGLRHAYGKRLKNSGVSGELITKAMNHKSLSSKEVYTEADHKEVSEALRLGSAEMERRYFDGR